MVHSQHLLDGATVNHDVLLKWEILSEVWKLLPLFSLTADSWRGMGGRVRQSLNNLLALLPSFYPIIPISFCFFHGLFCHFFSDSSPMLFSPLVFQGWIQEQDCSEIILMEEKWEQKLSDATLDYLGTVCTLLQIRKGIISNTVANWR